MVFDIATIIPGRKKETPSGWITFNCPACIHNGHRADTRYRAGVKNSSNGFTIHCFNCGFKSTFKAGTTITLKMRKFLGYCGISNDQILRWNLESLRNKDILDIDESTIYYRPEFKEVTLPSDYDILNTDNILHKRYVEYVESRNINTSSYPFMVNPHANNRYKDSILIPFTYDDVIVGYSYRFLDNKTPKYINHYSSGYVFGCDMIKKEWNYVIVTEGIFDALSVNGLALLHNDISDNQSKLINSLNKNVIVVPDRDKAGFEIIDKALSLGWMVSLPDWDSDVKDCNDAVKKYGKISTVYSILNCATSNVIKTTMNRKKYERNFKLQC